MSMDRGVDQEEVVHIHNGYYSAIKENEIPAFFATWMDLETIMPSEISCRKTNTEDFAYM